MKTSVGTASAVHSHAARRSVTCRRAKYSAARTPQAPTAPENASVEKLDPKRRKKIDWKYGVNGPNQYTTSR